MDNQRPLLYIALLFTGLMIYQAWVADQAPKPEPVSTAGTTAQNAIASNTPTSNLANADATNDLPEAGVGGVSGAANDMPLAGSGSAAQVQPQGVQAPQLIHVVTDVMDVYINARGGDIVEVKLPTYPVSLDQPEIPFQLLRSSPPIFIAQSGLLHDKVQGVQFSDRSPTHHSEFLIQQNEYRLSDDKEQLVVPLRWEGSDGVVVEKIYTFHRGQFVVDLDYEVNNQSSQPWIGRMYRQLRQGPAIDSDGSRLLYTYTGSAYYTDSYRKLSFDDMEDEAQLNEMVTGGWASMIQHYFVSAWIPTAEESNLLYTRVVNNNYGNEYIIGLRSEPIQVEAGSSGNLSTRFYAGPKNQDQLEDLAHGLELVADYGIFTVIAKPIFWLLTKINQVVNNWGWSIILLTILIKLVFYKLSETSYRSMAHMRRVAPKMQLIKERHANDKVAQQQAMMDLYKKEKINPLGGCLPILVQIPVFISLYWVLLESVELRQAPWILWIKDMSVKDPLFILPIIMGVTMYIQQKLNPAQPDPMMQKVIMAMPFVFTIFFAFFPAGLVLYWVANNILSIAQQWMITRQIERQA